MTAVLLGFLLVLALFCPITTMAAQTEQKTVRVGYYVNQSFQEGTSDEDVKSGYGYEYLRRVACYSGWKYEYVYGKWAELYERFLAGDIDIMAGVSQLEEREGYILFPDYEMGIEGYYLYKHEEDTEIVGETPSTFSGKRIGVIKNTTMADSLRKWLSEHPVDAEILEFDGFEAEQMAFDRGEIDAFVEMDFNISTGSGRAPVVKVGELPYYLAVTKDRPDLLAELNAALVKLNEVEPYFRQNLQYGNYRNSLISHTLSQSEQAWVQEHDVMNVGYFEAYLAPMQDVIRQRAAQENIDNIDYVLANWRDMNLEAYGMKERYDLVLCSINPRGVCSYETLNKMNQASRGGCCLMTFAGRGKGNHGAKLQRIILGRNLGTTGGNNIIFPFNVAYHMGGEPDLAYTTVSWERSQKPEAAIDSICRSYWRFVEITDEIRNKVGDYVYSHLEDGLYVERAENLIGIMVWDAWRTR